jgi:hypothetical protein
MLTKNIIILKLTDRVHKCNYGSDTVGNYIHF